MEKREVATKNYVIVAVIAIVVVGLVFYLASWYKTLKEHYLNNSVMTDIVFEIDLESLSSYVVDNPNIVVYIASATDIDVKSFEKKFKKLIADKEIQNEIVYFDVNKVADIKISKYFKEEYFSKKLNSKVKTVAVPNLLYFSGGEVTDILYSHKTNIDKNDVISFLERKEVIIND